MEEEHNKITFIPPPSKVSEEVPQSETQSATQERISSDVVTKEPPLENKIESTYSPEKVSRAPPPIERDISLTRIESDKKISIIKAWEESEKTKAENKAQKKMSSILSWENTETAAIEAKLRKKEEELEKKKAEYAEKLKNKMARIHKEAEMKRAVIESTRGKAFVEAEEKAAKYQATGTIPNENKWCCGTSA
ncbi:hypothetical protein LUZ63_011302 [Rhynchospora breviuscula]|uniref:Remorin C-terminal domain-containing protein n=1 Tax=Rhynchospora breviuscula TaxID=2022672 RepID=A0A9Q0HQE4_9POAL|nr:hypothetical protein LUZ63_011302 [Rhynchospora breviuscula]